MADELLFMFDPAFQESAEWGKATADDATEFKTELTKFQASLDETIRGFGAGVTLAKVRKDVDLDATLRTATTGGVVPQDVIHAYESMWVLALWYRSVFPCVVHGFAGVGLSCSSYSGCGGVVHASFPLLDGTACG
jgi:hypothetical protein